MMENVTVKGWMTAHTKKYYIDYFFNRFKVCFFSLRLLRTYDMQWMIRNHLFFQRTFINCIKPNKKYFNIKVNVSNDKCTLWLQHIFFELRSIQHTHYTTHYNLRGPITLYLLSVSLAHIHISVYRIWRKLFFALQDNSNTNE